MQKRRIIYCIIMMFLAGLWLWQARYEVFLIIVFILLITLTSFCYTFFIRKKIYIDIASENVSCIRGDVHKVNVNTRNEAYLIAVNIVVNMKCTYDNCIQTETIPLTIDAAANSTTVCEVMLKMESSGIMNIDINESWIYDIFGIFKFRLNTKKTSQIIVMPVLVTPDSYTLYTQYDNISDSNEYSSDKKGEDSAEIFDIREYENGDSMNRIHWKLSSRQQKLLVKEFSSPVDNDNYIFIDINMADTFDSRKNIDGIYELAYAAGNLACIREKRFKFICYRHQSLEMIEYQVGGQDELEIVIRNMVTDCTDKKNDSIRTDKDTVMEVFMEYIATYCDNANCIYICDDSKESIDIAFNIKEWSKSYTDKFTVFIVGAESKVDNGDDYDNIFVNRNDIKQSLSGIVI